MPLNPLQRNVAAGVAACLLLLQFGCAAQVRELWPPPPDAPAWTIYVSLDVWHAMIAFPLGPVQEPLGLSDKPSHAFEEWGFAERAWYLEGRQGLSGAVRALFWPTEGVVEVGRHDRVWAERTPQPPSDLFTFRVSNRGYQRLRRHLFSTISEPEPILAVGNTNFYPAKRSYHLFHQCHQYVARALQEAGLPTSVFWAFNRASLAMQLRRAARIASADHRSSVFRHPSFLAQEPRSVPDRDHPDQVPHG